MFGKSKKKPNKNKGEIIIDNGYEIEPTENTNRTGTFIEGYDKLKRPFRKKQYDDGTETKEEILKDGSRKFTIKKPPED